MPSPFISGRNCKKIIKNTVSKPQTCNDEAEETASLQSFDATNNKALSIRKKKNQFIYSFMTFWCHNLNVLECLGPSICLVPISTIFICLPNLRPKNVQPVLSPSDVLVPSSFHSPHSQRKRLFLWVCCRGRVHSETTISRTWSRPEETTVESHLWVCKNQQSHTRSGS